MKKTILAFLAVVASITAIAQPLPPPSTAYTRGLLTQPDQASAQSYLGVSGGSGGATNGIQMLDGTGTNTTFNALDDGVFHAAATFNAFSNNINSSSINLFGDGTNGSPIIHSMNKVAGKPVDYGLWGPKFGLPYTGAYGWDSYDLTNIATDGSYGPNLFWTFTGNYNTLLGDGGVSSHPIMRLLSTNLQVTFVKSLPANRAGTVATTFNSPTGTWQGFEADDVAAITGTGTIAISGTTITGTGTAFLSQFQRGARVFNGGTLEGTVVSIVSDTSATIGSAVTLGAGASYSIQLPSMRFDNIGAGALFSAFDSAAALRLHGQSSTAAIVIDLSGHEMGIGWSGTSFGFISAGGSGIPFFVDSGAANAALSVDSSSVTHPKFGLTADFGDITASSGNVILSTLAKRISYKSGANGSTGTGQLAGPVFATVNNTSVTANSKILCQEIVPSGGLVANLGSIVIISKIPGAGFTVQGGNAADTNTFDYFIFEAP